jgi:hypothetical protein
MASNKPTRRLFKKAYYFNWDDGVAGLQKIIEDRHCDLATATMIYWHGRPEGPHGPEMVAFLDGLKARILGGIYPTIVSYAIEPEFLPTTTDSIPARLLEPIVGETEFEDVLWPNNNPFQDEVLALCQHCDDAQKLQELESKGADFSKKILNGYALPIIVAINHGQLEVVKYLVSKGLDLNKKVDRAPLLAYAVGARSPDMVAWMIAHEANVQAKGQSHAGHRACAPGAESQIGRKRFPTFFASSQIDSLIGPAHQAQRRRLIPLLTARCSPTRFELS